jgi:hypothetical protein
MKESLLSQKEIEAILQEASNPRLKDHNLLIMPMNRTNVLKVTLINELIFIWGDDNTGWNHINQNHLQFQEKPKWRRTKNKDGSNYWQLKRHCFYPISTIPFSVYPSIADSIYKPENKTTKKNTNPDMYDLFTGDYHTIKDGIIPFNLLLYKDTKIIHNLYPTSDKFTPNRILKYKRSGLKGVLNPQDDIVKIEIPYLDHNNRTEYQIVFIQDYNQKKEIIVIERYKTDNSQDNFFITERKLQFDCFSDEVLRSYEFGDLSILEGLILTIDDHS